MSQWGQDRWVVELTNGKRNGYFLDIGAGHAIKDNNTWLLESQYGWNGICVDPTPEFYEDLKSTRKCIVVGLPVGPSIELVDYFFHGGVGGIFRNFTRQAIERNGATEGACEKVPAITLGLLLGKAPKTIDYWSLDTEGSEWDLIRTFPWDRHGVFCLSVEHNYEEPKRKLIQDFLASKSYQLIQRPECEFEDYYILK